MTVTPQPTPIPVPEDFPVRWDSPEEAQLLWMWNNTHFPGPVSPLGMDLMRLAVIPGLEKGLKAMGAPLREIRTKRVNTFCYVSMVVDPDLLSIAEERMQAAIRDRGFRIYQLWCEQWQPEVEAAIQRLRSFDYQGATDAQLAELVDWAVATDVRMWEIHFELMPGFYLAPLFKEACARLLGVSGLEAYEMMQGGFNLSVDASSRLWRLAHAAPAEVKEIIGSLPASQALTRLRETETGRAFLAELDRYLYDYGWRSGGLDLTEPSWVEEPTRAIDNVRLLLRVDVDPEEEQRRGAERAEALANRHRAALANEPEKLNEFNFLYEIVKQYPQMQENHNIYIDQTWRALLRLPFLETGRRMVARGLLAEAGDIVYLSLDEIRAFFAGDTTARQATVA